MLRVVGTLVRHCADIMETVRHQLATLGYVAPKVQIAETITNAKIQRVMNRNWFALDLIQTILLKGERGCADLAGGGRGHRLCS